MPLNLQNVTIENEVVEIDDATSFNAIGTGVTLRNCQIQIAVPAKSLSITAAIVGGVIQAKRELHGFDWLDARLDGVAFQGRFKNNRFGNFPPMYHHGSIANCDFSQAKLYDALFLNTDCRGVTFGPWPTFTVRNSPAFHASIERLEPSTMADFLRSLSEYFHQYNTDRVALNFMALNAEDVCKKEHFDLFAFQDCLRSVEGIAP